MPVGWPEGRGVTETIAFLATVQKVQTIAAGGFRIAFDTDGSHVRDAALLLAYADATGVMVRVTVEQVEAQSDRPWLAD